MNFSAWWLTKENSFTKNNIEALAEYYDIDLSAKLRDKMVKLYNEYKDYIRFGLIMGIQL